MMSVEARKQHGLVHIVDSDIDTPQYIAIHPEEAESLAQQLNALGFGVKTCEWKLDLGYGSRLLKTGCSDNALPEELKGESFTFCPYCGGKIVEVK